MRSELGLYMQNRYGLSGLTYSYILLGSFSLYSLFLVYLFYDLIIFRTVLIIFLSFAHSKI